MRWTAALIAAWACVWALGQARQALPASWWYEAGHFEVSDAEVGMCPDVAFDRTINRDVLGTWLVTLQRQNSVRGGYYVFRQYQGQADYRRDSELPEDLDMSWWADLSPTECNWPAGTYRVLTVWTFYPDGVAPKTVRRASGPFKIYRPA